MARSIAWPFRKTLRGGLALTDSGDHGRGSLHQVITLGVLPSHSANPFDAEAEVNGVDTVFTADNGSLSGRCIQAVQRLFKRFENQGRAKLQPGYPKRELSDDGEIVMRVRFVDLEANQPGDVEVK
jgi:hypothetical protein